MFMSFENKQLCVLLHFVVYFRTPKKKRKTDESGVGNFCFEGEWLTLCCFSSICWKDTKESKIYYIDITKLSNIGTPNNSLFSFFLLEKPIMGAPRMWNFSDFCCEILHEQKLLLIFDHRSVCYWIQKTLKKDFLTNVLNIHVMKILVMEKFVLN